MKGDRAVDLDLPFENVAGLAQKMRNVDSGERIGAGDDQQIAVIQTAKGFSCAQSGHRTVEAAKVKSRGGRFDVHPRQVYGNTRPDNQDRAKS
jgi:hypothetical protein